MHRDQFTSVVGSRLLVWRRTAYFICGDWHRADDLVQQAALRMYLRWHRIEPGAVDAYARRVITRLAIDDARRSHRRNEVSGDPPERAVSNPGVEDALVIRDALVSLPAGQRAAVVLRYYQGLSVAETAAVLGVTAGTVKSQTSRGLTALRATLTSASGYLGASFVVRPNSSEVEDF